MGIKVPSRLIITLLVICTGVFPAVSQASHTMKSGDTLYSLSRKYGVSVDELLEANGISDPSSLSVGTELVIPELDTADEDAPGEYQVKKGDTYYSIARSHGMVVDELLSLNGRGSDRILRVGEILIVKAGDGGGNPGGTVTTDPKPVPTPSPGPVEVTMVPWWPVAGMKTPLEGKLVGVSIDADPRSYVHAVADGQVVWTGPYRGFGHVVLVDSNGYIYLYGGNEDLFVNVGQAVATGSRIGRLGAPGPEGETMKMFFSVFREGVPVSPEEAPRG